MKQTKLRTLILAAMFAALTCVATMIIHIPSPIGGYFNLGDCMVLLSAFVLGPVWGTAAGGIGSALADVICGYFIYAPGTLVIKALMALAAALIFRAFAKNGSRFGKTFSGSLLGSVAAEIIMVVGYSLGRAFIYATPEAALLKLPYQILQAAVGALVGTLLVWKCGLRKLFNEKLMK